MSANYREMAAIAQPVFESQGWTWYGLDDNGFTPNIDDLAAFMKELKKSLRKDSTMISSGRISVVPPDDVYGYRFFLELGDAAHER